MLDGPLRGLRARALAMMAAPGDLRRRCDEVAERVARLTWDLGGLAFEMAIRDHFRLDVLVRRAAALQEAAAELGELQRLLAAAEQGITGNCRSCGAVHSGGASYCWRCGQLLMGTAHSTAVSTQNDALLSPGPDDAG